MFIRNYLHDIRHVRANQYWFLERCCSEIFIPFKAWWDGHPQIWKIFASNPTMPFRVDTQSPCDLVRLDNISTFTPRIHSSDKRFHSDNILLPSAYSHPWYSISGPDKDAELTNVPGGRNCTNWDQASPPATPRPSRRLTSSQATSESKRRPKPAPNRRALAARYREVMNMPDAERTDEERAQVRQIVTLKLLERLAYKRELSAVDVALFTCLMWGVWRDVWMGWWLCGRSRIERCVPVSAKTCHSLYVRFSSQLVDMMSAVVRPVLGLSSYCHKK